MNKEQENEMDAFTTAYLECALWASFDDDDAPLDVNYGVEDFAPIALADAIADCAAFQAANAEDIAGNYAQAGHDFWLTRNGHGVGFWDGDWTEDAGDRLTVASTAFGESNLYVANGLVYSQDYKETKTLDTLQKLVDGTNFGLFNLDSVIADLLQYGESDKGVILLAYLRKQGEDVQPDEISEVSATEFDYGRSTYKVLTDKEADEAAGKAIEESLWAFNAQFLAYETELPIDVFQALQHKCEGANDIFRKLIDTTCGIDQIVNQAIADDGRGYFLSSYDGEEGDLRAGSKWFFIYRN